MNVREEAVKFARQLLVAVATSAVIIGGLLLAFQGQSNEERELTRVLVELQEQTGWGPGVWRTASLRPRAPRGRLREG